MFSLLISILFNISIIWTYGCTKIVKIPILPKFSSTSDSLKIRHFDRYQINTDSIICKELYSEVYDWMGVKYRYGMGSKEGTDCSHLVSNIFYKVFGAKLGGSAGSIYSFCKDIKKEDLKEGDLLFFKINKSYISHVGIYLQKNKFVHATVNKGVMISDLNEAYYKKYYFCSGRITGIN